MKIKSMKTKILLASIYKITEIALLYSIMTYFGYGDFTYRWQVLTWAIISSVVISLTVAMVF